MLNNFESLQNFIYPGRFIVIGKQDDGFYILYGVTARSESSRAKKYIYERSTQTIKVEAANFATMSLGNLDLLDYNAARIFQNGIIIGNGKQTNNIKSFKNSAVETLAEYLQTETFEPDKYQTPRITGALINNDDQISAALYIIKADENLQPLHQAYDLALESTQAYFIATYNGENIRPTPSFNQDPILLNINFESAQQATQQIYNHFHPKANQPDLRVSVIGIKTDNNLSEKEVCIINYHK